MCMMNLSNSLNSSIYPWLTLTGSLMFLNLYRTSFAAWMQRMQVVVGGDHMRCLDHSGLVVVEDVLQKELRGSPLRSLLPRMWLCRQADRRSLRSGAIHAAYGTTQPLLPRRGQGSRDFLRQPGCGARAPRPRGRRWRLALYWLHSGPGSGGAVWSVCGAVSCRVVLCCVVVWCGVMR